jgi:hypothetical protein
MWTISTLRLSERSQAPREGGFPQSVGGVKGTAALGRSLGVLCLIRYPLTWRLEDCLKVRVCE